MNLYKLNNPSDFMTRLHTPITLHGNWEVALVEYFYPNTMYNIPEEQKIFVKQIISFGAMPPIVTSITIPAGIYTAKTLIDCIDVQAPQSAQFGQARLPVLPATAEVKAFRCYQLESERKTRIHFNNLMTELTFPESSQHIRKMLGFTESTVCSTDDPNVRSAVEDALRKGYANAGRGEPQLSGPNLLGGQLGQVEYLYGQAIRRGISKPEDSLLKTQSEVKSTRCINMSYGNQSLYLYTDIVCYGAVGDAVVQLLRTIPIKAGSAFEMVTERFDRPHYVPVIRNHIEALQMTVCSDLGNNAKFESGKTLTKLHFRPVRNET